MSMTHFLIFVCVRHEVPVLPAEPAVTVHKHRGVQKHDVDGTLVGGENAAAQLHSGGNNRNVLRGLAMK